MDITGRKFGKLTAIKEGGRDDSGRSVWICLCDCGREWTGQRYSLTSGITVQCRECSLKAMWGDYETVSEKIESLVNKTIDEDCHIWEGPIRQNGGPRVSFKSKCYSVRNEIYSKHYNIKLEKNTNILTSCGKSLCVNPEHLIVNHDPSKLVCPYCGGKKDKRARNCKKCDYILNPDKRKGTGKDWHLSNSGYIVKNMEGKTYLQHRYVMEEYLGRPLLANEHVHHKDGDKGNNNIDNLELLSASEHLKLHRAQERAEKEGNR